MQALSSKVIRNSPNSLNSRVTPNRDIRSNKVILSRVIRSKVTRNSLNSKVIHNRDTHSRVIRNKAILSSRTVIRSDS